MDSYRRILTVIMLLCSLCLSGQEKKIKVACIGDSVTYGTGIEDRENDSYPSQLQKMLGEGYEVGNFGRPGATLLRKGHRPYMQQPEFAAAMAYAGDIAVIHLGLNDTDPRNWPNYKDEFIGDYIALIDSVRAANPSARVMIALMSPITPKHHRFISGTRQWHAEIQQAIAMVAEAADAVLLDFHSGLYNHQRLLPDSLHPNAEGAHIIADEVFKAITGNYGGLKMPEIFCDHMVLQRDIPLLIKGTADAGTEVSLKLEGPFRTVRKSTTASATGKWEIMLDPLKAGTGLKLTIENEDSRLVFNDVAAGEVWLCSGQSNMAFMLSEAENKEVVGDKNLRFFNMKPEWNTLDERWSDETIAAVQNLDYYRSAEWECCNERNTLLFSAVGYHFGRLLRDNLDVPVGLICNAIGGSTTESWIDRNSLESEFPAILNDWLNNDFIQDWARGRAAKNIGYPESEATRHPYEPCYLYESGIMPVRSYPIKGVIWYQGESNAHNIEAHEQLFTILVKSWRATWNNPSLPFRFVQLSSMDRPSWTWFRDSQRRLAESIPECSMAVSSDVGDSLDVHPRKKKPVGERLARIALHEDYGLDIEFSGPTIRKATYDKGKVVLEFDHADGLRTSDGKPPRLFEIAGKEGIFHTVKAIIKRNKVIIDIDDMIPSMVRYGWQPYTRSNLINDSGLPASTFRIDISE